MEKVEAYRTKDGKLFENKSVAAHYEAQYELSLLATEEFSDNLGDEVYDWIIENREKIESILNQLNNAVPVVRDADSRP